METGTAEQPLLVRYLAWSDRWRGHEDHLESRAGDLGSSEEKSLGKALLKAVMANQGWVPSGGEVASAASRCVGKDLCADAAEMMRKSTDAPVIVSFWDLGQEPQLTVAQFTPVSFDLLKQKIEQFPKGTLFEVYQFAETKIKNQALYGRIMKMLVDAGMKAD